MVRPSPGGPVLVPLAPAALRASAFRPGGPGLGATLDPVRAGARARPASRRAGRGVGRGPGRSESGLGLGAPGRGYEAAVPRPPAVHGGGAGPPQLRRAEA